ncbi:L-lactate dehydrogenase [Vibrio tritonius]|uniref:L-lactate dehydrogenase n=1 Tax=Vibrio tritonius TaxID=1435069 RepID=UPI0008383AAC|nr:L-lactate dehydrogenase [Vibrio tritonius]
MSIKTRKVAVIGVGRVGSHVASHLVTRGLCDELVLIDKDTQKAESHRIDLRDGAAFGYHRMTISCGEYSDLDDADVVVISASGPIVEENRLLELDNNLSIINEVATKLKATKFNGVVISITNPCDVVAQYFHELTGFSVIGTGTLIDSARLRAALSRETGISPRYIQAYCLGEHGNSQFVAQSHVSFMGVPLAECLKDQSGRFDGLDFAALQQEVIRAGWDIFKGKNATEFGISTAACELIDAIFHDDGRVLPCSTLLNGQYGQHDVYASTPCVIGKEGVQTVLELNLTIEEQVLMAQTCDIIKKHRPTVK